VRCTGDPAVRALLLLSPPGRLVRRLYWRRSVVLFVSAFWQVDSFTAGRPRLDARHFHTLISSPTYRTIALRTIGIAAAVTVTRRRPRLCRLPTNAARVAPRRVSSILFVAVLLPCG